MSQGKHAIKSKHLATEHLSYDHLLVENVYFASKM